MVNTIFILDRNKETSKILSANKQSRNIFWDDVYHQELVTGAESFEFTCYADERIVEGVYAIFYYNQQYKMFTIMEIEEEHSEGQIVSHCYCEISSMELINQYVRSFSGEMNCLQFFQYILNNTGWYVGKYNTSLENKIATIDVQKAQSVWDLIEDYKDIFECEINIRVTYDNGKITGQFIDIYAEGNLGTPTYKRLEYGRNVMGISKSKDLYDWATGLIVDVEGVNELTFSRKKGDPFDKEVGDVILDPTNNEIYNAGRGYIMGVYQGEEKDPRTACLDAWKELQKRAVPKFDYEVTTALTSEEYENLHLGDTVYVIDYGYTPPLLLEARVGELDLSFTDTTQNKCTLTNYKEVKSRLMGAEYIRLTGTITDVVNAFFPVGPDGIADGAIVDGKIDTVYYQEITADIVSAGIGVFEDLYTRNMTVINADIENLKAEKATITELNATNANVKNLTADVADINTLVNGHLTSDNIQSLILTSDKVTVADAFIKNAMIESINANKINTGIINTNNVSIQSADGSMLINGTTQQFKDKNGKVRIQIGKDAQGNFTFTLFDANGTGILINQDGITKNAIADGLIVNDMVAENANISGGKIDIDSLVSEINDGTSTLKGSKIKLDNTNQTLDVSFSTLSSKVDNMEIGGTNLVRNGSFSFDLQDWERSSANVYTATAQPGVDGGKCVKIVGRLNGTEVAQQFVDNFIPGKEYTYSCYMKGENIVKGTTNYFVKLNLAYYKDTAYLTEISTPINLSGTTPWTKAQVTHTVPSEATRIRVSCYARDFTGNVYFDHIKVEKGNKATDWSPNPAEVDGKISSALTDISVQQGQINTLISNTTITRENGQVVQLKDDYNTTKSTVNSNTTKIGSLTTTVNGVSSKQSTLTNDLNGFKTTVSDTYATKSSLNTTNNNVSSISTKQSSLESSLNSFKTTVANTYATTSGVSSTYATKSELKQTSDEFTFKIEQSGGYNLLFNGNFANGQAHWSGWETSRVVHVTFSTLNGANSGVTMYGGIGETYFLTQTVSGLNLTEPVTFSYSRFLHAGTDGATNPFYKVEVIATYTDDTISFTQAANAGDIITGSWRRYSGTIKPNGKVIKSLLFVCYCRDTTRTVSYGNLMIQTGETLNPWAPNPNEVRSGIVTIDKDGISVVHGSYKSQLDSDALKFYTGDELYSRIDGGRYSFTDGNGTLVGWVGRAHWRDSNSYISTLNAEFKHGVSLASQHEAGGSQMSSLVVSSQSGTISEIDTYFEKGLNLLSPSCNRAIWFKPNLADPVYGTNTVKIGSGYVYAYHDQPTGSQGLGVMGNSRMIVGIVNGENARTGMAIIEDSNEATKCKAKFYCNVDMNGYTISGAYSTYSLNAQSDYTRRLLNTGTNENINHSSMSYDQGEIRWCWKETVFTYPECDIDPVTDEWIYTGRNICYIELPIFMAENIQNDYHVHIGKMGWGDYRIVEKNPYYFILESKEEDFAFTFEVVAKLNDNQTLAPNTNIAYDNVENPTMSDPPEPEFAPLPNDITHGNVIQENIITGEE